MIPSPATSGTRPLYKSLALDPQAGQHEILAVLARSLPASAYLEIGVRDGGTLWVVVEAARNLVDELEGQHLILADDWGIHHGGTNRGSHEHIAHLLHVLEHRGSVTWLDGRSQDTIPAIIDGIVGRVDLAHVDGDHDEGPAFEDMKNCYECLRPGGTMVVHDTCLQSVRRAVDAFLDWYEVASSFHSGGKGTAVFWRVTT